VSSNFRIFSENRLTYWLIMRSRRPIPVVALIVFWCATDSGFAGLQQDHASERDQKILQIQQLIEDHDLAEASREILEASKQYPRDAGLDNLLGIVEAQQGNYTAAEKSFHQALKREPKFTGASLNLGRLYQENSAVDSQARRKALGVYLGVLAYDPKNAEANYQSAALLLEQGKYRDSLDHISRLPEESQSGAQVLSILCADYAALGARERDRAAALGPKFFRAGCSASAVRTEDRKTRRPNYFSSRGLRETPALVA
jgi:tetratricopeptide (TPR) repeat protein